MKKKKNFFLATRKLTGPYKFIIQSTKIHSEKLLDQQLVLKECNEKRYDFIAMIYMIIIVFKTNFFSKKKIMQIKYRGFNISRYAVPEIYKNYNTYLNFYSFFFESIKCFYINLVTLREFIKIDKNNIAAAFVDHGMYRNGLIMSVLSKRRIPIYTLGYPRGIFYFINKRKKPIDYENIIELKKLGKINNKKIIQAKKSIHKVINKTEIIPWMKSIKFVNTNKKFNEITHLIYIHSFTDAQMLYGYDEFVNVYDWLEFTIRQLTKNKKNKILVKAHPSFFNLKSPTKYMSYDRKIFFKVISKYSKHHQIVIIKEPIKNGDLLKKLNKKTILISHHGSAILEGLYLNFKCIVSRATFWSNKFQLTNDWHSRIAYKKLLFMSWKKLKKHNKNDLYNVCYQLFCNPLSLYGNHYWQEIMSKELNIPRQIIYEKSAYIFDKIDMKNKIIQKVAKKISKTIVLVKV
jgi:hypothetical protein